MVGRTTASMSRRLASSSPAMSSQPTVGAGTMTSLSRISARSMSPPLYRALHPSAPPPAVLVVASVCKQERDNSWLPHLSTACAEVEEWGLVPHACYRRGSHHGLFRGKLVQEWEVCRIGAMSTNLRLWPS